METLIIVRFKRYITHYQIVRKFQAYIWYFTFFLLFSQLYIPKNAYGTKCNPNYMVIIHKWSYWQYSWQIKVFSNYGWSTVPHLKTWPFEIHENMVSECLKISPKKCKLFGIELQYMSDTILSKIAVCIKSFKSRLEVIYKLKPLKTAKDCKPFAGVVNYVSMFLSKFPKTPQTHILFNKKR